MWNRCSAGLIAITLIGCRPKGPPEDTPYKIAAEDFSLAYCSRAFSDGCSVPEDCGIPGGFDSRVDCELRLVPYLRSCAVPAEEADPIIAELESCAAVLDAASCDESLCDGGPLDTDPCLGLFTTLSGYCTFEGL